MSSRCRLLAALVGPALAGSAVGSQLLCQPAETLRGEKANMKEEKGANIKRWLGSPKNQAMRSSKCNLAGLWKNDLGSTMQVYNVDNEGNFSGTYHTAVSSAKQPIQPSPLRGSQHLDEDGKCTFGFVVNWKSFSDSTTVFVGQCFVDDKEREVLQTAWLLRDKVDGVDSNWKATKVGYNVFTRENREKEEKFCATVPPPA